MRASPWLLATLPLVCHLTLACGDDSTGAGGAGANGGAATAGGSTGGNGGAGPAIGSVRAFGFVAVGCHFDDPLDEVAKDTYFDEVAGFTNVAHVCAFDPTTDLRPTLEELAAGGSRALLDLNAILFETTFDPGTGHNKNTVRPDAAARWSSFVATNGDVLDAAHVAAFYPIDEPTWTGVSSIEMEQTVALTKATHPEIPVLLVEAYPALAELVVPPNVDWVAFDRYYLADPANDPTYLADLETLKAARSRPDQKIVLILDSHHTSGHTLAGIAPEDMLGVAESYAALAAREPDVVGVLGYLWPGGLEGAEQKGARELPDEVRAFYESWGAAVVAAP